MQNNKDKKNAAPNRNFQLADYSNEFSKVISKMTDTGGSSLLSRLFRERTFSREQTISAIESGSLREKREVSKYYFGVDGFYRRILVYYATLLKYMGVLIPNPNRGQGLQTTKVQSKYFRVLDFVDKMNIPVLLTEIALKILVSGAYFGMMCEVDRQKPVFTLIDLPPEYCRSESKTVDGIDVVELNLEHFRTKFKDQSARTKYLQLFPQSVRLAWERYEKEGGDNWVALPSELGIYMTLYDEVPMFLNVIIATLDYDEAIQTEKERALDEIHKIIVQKVPHNTSTDALLFDPVEAAAMHTATVDMLGKQKNMSVLTTFLDVDAIASKTSADNQQNIMSKMVNNIYSEAGTSLELFNSTGAQTLRLAMKKDLALMMHFANKASALVERIINYTFNTSVATFSYRILPISLFNDDEYAKAALSQAQAGFSFILPAVAMGIPQKDLVNLKFLENELLELGEKLVPLQLSYTQSGNDRGRPAKKLEDLDERTAQNKEDTQRKGEPD